MFRCAVVGGEIVIWLIFAVLGVLFIFAQAFGAPSWAFVASFGWLGVGILGLVWLVRTGPSWWRNE